MKRPLFSLGVLTLATFILVFCARPTDAVGNKFSKENCADAQIYMSKTLRKNDLRARVDRIQFYDSMHHDLDILATRMSKNSQPGAVKLQTLVKNLDDRIEKFKDNYEVYDLSREKASNTSDCFKNYTKFQELLRIAQKNRDQLHSDIANLNRVINRDISSQLDETHAVLTVETGLER